MPMLVEGVDPQPDPIENKYGEKVGDEDDFHKPVDQTPYDDPFGNEETAEVKYKTLKWCAIILIVGLGIVALYTGYVIGQFRQRYPHIHNLADAGEILLGRFGRELFGLGQILFSIFIMGSHIVTFTVMMNTITDHGTCSIVFSVVAFLSIFSAVMITMIGVGVQYKGGVNMNITNETNLYHAFTAVTNIVFAYCAHVAFFGLIAEMEEPKDFPKALCLLQVFEICLYVVAAVVIYYYVGNDVTSPALGSAGPVLKKVAYGIAIPTIVGAGVVNGHVGLKYIYVRLFRRSGRMHSRDWVSVGSWVGIGVSCWVIAWIIAEGIPTFTNIVSLICGLGLYVSGKAIHDDSAKSSFSCANTAD
ncbi:hypothetical protein ATERTT37_000051 [Aspergillus terreus]